MKPITISKPETRAKLEADARKVGFTPTAEDRDADLRAIIQERKAA